MHTSFFFIRSQIDHHFWHALLKQMSHTEQKPLKHISDLKKLLNFLKFQKEKNTM